LDGKVVNYLFLNPFGIYNKVSYFRLLIAVTVCTLEIQFELWLCRPITLLLRVRRYIRRVGHRCAACLHLLNLALQLFDIFNLLVDQLVVYLLLIG
jgi:hypothetical protein